MEISSKDLSLNEKLKILDDAAKYDVACTSSGSSRRGKKGMLGNTEAAGICHSFSPDGRCVSLLKILLSNECIYDCKYCLNRVSNDRVRTTFTPDEICTLVVEFYRRNYIEGLFLSSGIVKSPTYTMELMYQAIYLLRTKYHFNGYIHVKAIPGTSDELITNMGYLVDRMSVNLELPTIDGLKKLAPHKNPKKLVAPIRQIQNGIVDHPVELVKRGHRLIADDAVELRKVSNRQIMGTPRRISAILSSCAASVSSMWPVCSAWVRSRRARAWTLWSSWKHGTPPRTISAPDWRANITRFWA